jgi:hypothetical protein
MLLRFARHSMVLCSCTHAIHAGAALAKGETFTNYQHCEAEAGFLEALLYPLSEKRSSFQRAINAARSDKLPIQVAEGGTICPSI